MATILSKIRSWLRSMGGQAFAYPYLPDALLWIGVFLGATGVSLTLVAQPYYYWFDFHRAQSPVGFINVLLGVSPFVFLGAGLLYLFVLLVVYGLFTRSVAFLVWMPVSFVNILFLLTWCWGWLPSGKAVQSGMQEAVAGILATVLLALILLFFLFRTAASPDVAIPKRSKSLPRVIFGIWGLVLAGSMVLSALHPWKGWQLNLPAHSPGPRAQAAVAYDPASKYTILFGGITEWIGYENYYHNDTWAWDGVDWRQLHPVDSPSPRAGQAMAYDERNSVLVLFGGAGPGNFSLGDTWLWDGKNWAQAIPDNAPGPRRNPVMFYDPLLQKVILAGGYGIFGSDQTAQDYQDVWEWDGGNWTPLPPQNVSAYLRSPAAVYAPGLQQTLVMNYNGLWAWQDGQWSMQQNASAPNKRLDAWIAAGPGGDAVLFGGKSGNTVLNDTWLLHMGRWAQLNPATAPEPRYAFVMFYDPVSRGYILYGGLDSQNNILSDTWTYAKP